MMHQGVHKRWKHTFLIKELKGRIIYPADRPDLPEFQENIKRQLEAYADAISMGDDSLIAITAASRLELHGLLLMRWATYTLLINQNQSLEKLSISALYKLRAIQIWQARNIAWVAEGKKPHRSIKFSDSALALATACSFGWLDAAKKLGNVSLQMLPLGAYRDANPFLEAHYVPERRCFAWFTVKLFADWTGQTIAEPLPRHPYPSPAYDALLACWRDPDPAHLIAPLLAVCDWHTHECMYSRSMHPSKSVDFISDPYMGWPVEVHMVYRLRESLGLPNPAELDHPLMKTALAPYLPPQPVPLDDLLERVTARALQEYPTLTKML